MSYICCSGLAILLIDQVSATLALYVYDCEEKFVLVLMINSLFRYSILLLLTTVVSCIMIAPGLQVLGASEIPAIYTVIAFICIGKVE